MNKGLKIIGVIFMVMGTVNVILGGYSWYYENAEIWQMLVGGFMISTGHDMYNDTNEDK